MGCSVKGKALRVGIITLLYKNYNYGAILQAYALQKAVEKLGHKAEIINYDRRVETIDSVNLSISKKIKQKLFSINSYGDFFNLTRLALPQKEYVSEVGARKDAFHTFYKEKMSVSKYYNLATIEFANDMYDAFICGSDQIWRPTSFDPNYYLAFADNSKTKFSYAASLGVKELSEEAVQTMVPLIKKLNGVSVRENDAVDLLKKSGVDSKLVVDPTLLWGHDFWSDIATEPNLEKGKYVFSYIIGENNKNRDVATKIAKMNKKTLVTIPGISRIMPYDFSYADCNITDASPTDFLGLIKNAAFVVTDSFHACVFSIIFNTPFVALERSSKSDSNSMNGRIYSLLNLFSLENRLIRNDQTLDTNIFSASIPNYEKYNQLCDMSWNYLKSNIVAPTGYASKKYEFPKAVYAAQNVDVDARKQSSSGGIFKALAENVLSDNGAVVACKLDETGKAVHDICYKREELNSFLTSKYVQSYMGNVIEQIAVFLQNGKKVMFVGTPCQAEGVNKYLAVRKIDTNNFISVDFICHGVPSPLVWEKYLGGITEGNENSFITANFRNKDKGWKKYSLSVITKDKMYERDKENDPYLLGFLNNYFLRPSCYKCHQKRLKHNTDITLGDFWHIDECKSSLKDDNTGISLVISQTEKGENVLHSLSSIKLEKKDFECVAVANKNMFLSAIISKSRKSFFQEYYAFADKHDNYDSMKVFLESKANHSTLDKIKKIIKKIMGR